MQKCHMLHANRPPVYIKNVYYVDRLALSVRKAFYFMIYTSVTLLLAVFFVKMQI
jgi:hypothetical protein